jgi:hypothetical protein
MRPPLPAAWSVEEKREAEEGLGAMKKPRRTPARLIGSELGREGRVFEQSDVTQLLRSAIEREGDQVAFAGRRVNRNLVYFSGLRWRRRTSQ